MDIVLDAIEVRVLGSLMEKELATPEYYPLSLNALVNACNQKSNRSPVLSLDERTVASALQSLKEKNLSDVGLVSKLPLSPGRKEQRFAHLLAGEPENIEQVAARQEPIMIAVVADNERIAELEKSVAYLKEEIEVLKNEFE